MNADRIVELSNQYKADGFVSPVDIINLEQAGFHRAEMENAERQIGKLHYIAKVHTILTSPYILATNPLVLDIVEQILGSDILLYNVTYIVKEPGSKSHVSWHQDLTYWGLSSDEQVTMWLALSPATKESGCMRMQPGSHLGGKVAHDITTDKDNVLLQGQTVNNVNENDTIICELQPGQASFHHGWTLHASMPNVSNDRRIGLNVQYIAPHVQTLKQPGFTAMTVRGEDRYQHYQPDLAAVNNLDPLALKNWHRLDDLYKSIAGTN